MSLLCPNQFLRIFPVYLSFLALILVSARYANDCFAQQVRVVPSISIIEQYDSNVFFTPKSQLPPGTKADDLISSFTPQLNLTHSSSLVNTNLSVGAVIQKFAHNSELDNVGYNAAAGIDLSQAVNRVLPRMRALRVFGAYRYSPNQSAFGAVGYGGGMGTGTVGIAGPVDSGLITQRIKTTMYQAGFTDSYSLSPTTDFQTGYTYSQLNFGNAYTGAPVSNTYFDTTTHSITAGPTSKISATDSLSVKYIFNSTSQAQFGEYTTHAGNVAWGRSWTREWSSSLNGGLTLIEPIPDTSAAGGQRRIPATITPIGGFSVTYASGSSFLRKLGSDIRDATGGSTAATSFLPFVAGMNIPGGIATPGSYQVTLMYNTGVYPSFVQSAGPIYTHLVSLGGMAGITDKLTAQGFLNYARSSYTSDSIGSTFSTYGTTVALNYLITPTFTARLSHQWLSFDNNQSNAAGVADLAFSKHVILLAFTYAYAPRGDFFRSGAFWEGPSGASSSDAGKSGSGGDAGKSGSGGVEIKK